MAKNDSTQDAKASKDNLLDQIEFYFSIIEEKLCDIQNVAIAGKVFCGEKSAVPKTLFSLIDESAGSWHSVYAMRDAFAKLRALEIAQ